MRNDEGQKTYEAFISPLQGKTSGLDQQGVL